MRDAFARLGLSFVLTGAALVTACDQPSTDDTVQNESPPAAQAAAAPSEAAPEASSQAGGDISGGQVASIAAPTQADEIAYQAALNGRWGDEIDGCDAGTFVFRPGTVTTPDELTCNTEFTHINRGVASITLVCGEAGGPLETRFTHWPRTDRLALVSTSGVIERAGLRRCE